MSTVFDVSFLYKNHRGVDRIVTVQASTICVWNGSTEHHKAIQPLMTAWDLDRDAERTYALRAVIAWYLPEEADAGISDI